MGKEIGGSEQHQLPEDWVEGGGDVLGKDGLEGGIVVECGSFTLTVFVFFAASSLAGQSPAEGSDPSGNAESCPPAQSALEGEATTDGSAAPWPSSSLITSCQHQRAHCPGRLSTCGEGRWAGS